jgi:hypothetical protein
MTDRTVVLAVVVLLGAFCLLGLGGLIWLIDHGSDGEVLAIVAGPTSAALGALGALLASTRSSEHVRIVNPPSDPVPTQERGAIDLVDALVVVVIVLVILYLAQRI